MYLKIKKNLPVKLKFFVSMTLFDDANYFKFKSEDSHDWPKCLTCGDSYCIKDDCGKYDDPNYYEDLGRSIIKIFNEDQKDEKKNFKIKPKNYKRKKFKTLYTLGGTLNVK